VGEAQVTPAYGDESHSLALAATEWSG